MKPLSLQKAGFILGRMTELPDVEDAQAQLI